MLSAANTVEPESRNGSRVDDGSGIIVEQKTVSKGLLKQITISIKHDPTGIGWHALEPCGDDEKAINWLRDAKQAAQKVLHDAGLPSDLNRPYQYLSLRQKLEPLSREEYAARLIEKIDDVLSHKNGLVALHALQFASALHNFLLADGLNEDAVEGAEAPTFARTTGPRTCAFVAMPQEQAPPFSKR